MRNWCRRTKEGRGSAAVAGAGELSTKGFSRKNAAEARDRQAKNRSVFLSIRGAGYLTSQLEPATGQRRASQIYRKVLPKWQARSGGNCLIELAQPVFVRQANYATR